VRAAEATAPGIGGEAASADVGHVLGDGGHEFRPLVGRDRSAGRAGEVDRLDRHGLAEGLLGGRIEDRVFDLLLKRGHGLARGDAPHDEAAVTGAHHVVRP